MTIDRLPAVFVKSAAALRDCPESSAEIAFAGRSNAGKSSVLNRLAGQRKLARTSKTPGRTRLLNFFHVAEGRHLVDLPGYGYAKAARSEREAWQRAIEPYLEHRETLTGLVLVMDIRHPFQPFDEQMLAWAQRVRVPLHLLLNKADKLSRGAASAAVQAARRHALFDESLMTVQAFSALKGTGLEALITRILELLALEVADAAPATSGPAPEGR